MAIQADVVQDQEVREMVNTVARQFGTIDLLVNNASITVTSLLDLKKRQPKKYGTTLCSQCKRDVLLRSGSGTLHEEQ